MSITPIDIEGAIQDGGLRSSFLDALYEKIDGDNGLSKCCAVRALERLGARDDRSADALLQALDDNDPDVRIDASAALGRLRLTAAAPALLDHLKRDGEGEVRVEVAKAVGSLTNKECVPALLECIRGEGYPDLDPVVDDYEFSPAWDVQAEALEALGRIGDPAAAAPIVELLGEPENDHLFEAGFRILGGLDSPVAHGFLLETLWDGSEHARVKAARALGRSLKAQSAGDRASEIGDGLVVALRDPSAAVRIAAAQALSSLDGKIAVVPLSELLSDSDIEVRLAVIAILAQFTGATVSRHLELMLKDPRRKVKRAAVNGLGKVGDPACGDALGELLTTRDDRLAFDVIEVAGMIGTFQHCQTLGRILNDTARSQDIRMEAASALGAILERLEDEDPQESRDALVQAVGGRDASVASAALMGLSIGAPEVAESMVVSLFAENDTAFVTEDLEQEQELETYEVPNPVNSTLGAILVRAHADAELSSKARRSIKASDPRRRLKLLGLRLLGLRLAGLHSSGLSSAEGAPQSGSSALEILAGVLSSDDAEFRREAVLALGRSGIEGTGTVLCEALGDPDVHVRAAALESLVDREFDEAAQDKIAALSRDADPRIRSLVLQATPAMGPDKRLSIICAALEDDSEIVCRAAVRTLSDGDLVHETRTALVKLSRRHSGNLRFDIGRSLNRLNETVCITSFLEMLEDQGQEEFHWICMDMLAETFSIGREFSGADV